MIIKYQIDETSIYLAKLLSLPRAAIKNKIDQSFEKYKGELKEYSNSGQYHAQDLKETQHKAKQIKKRLKKENNKNLLASLKIQNLLIQKYESAIDAEKLNNLTGAQNRLEKMTFLIEALYLTAITAEELRENNKLYRHLSIHFHPDKAKNEDGEIKEQKNEFFKTFTPLLSSNTSNDHLRNIIQSIQEKRNERIEQINNPSALASAGHFLCSTAIPPIGQAIGTFLCHKTFAQIMPRSEDENILRDICVMKSRDTALEIETKLVKLPRHLQ